MELMMTPMNMDDDEDLFWKKIGEFRAKYGWNVTKYHTDESMHIVLPILLKQQEMNFYVWAENNRVEMTYVSHRFDQNEYGVTFETETWYVPNARHRIMMKLKWS
jgi:hypothetical protein